MGEWSRLLRRAAGLFVVLEQKPLAGREVSPTLRAFASMVFELVDLDGRIDATERKEAWDLAKTMFPEADRETFAALMRAPSGSLDQACAHLARAWDSATRAELLQGLYGLAITQGRLSRTQRAWLRRAGKLLLLPAAVYRLTLARALGSTALCYELLDLAPGASVKELEAALARRRLELAGQDEEELAMVVEAFETLRSLQS